MRYGKIGLSTAAALAANLLLTAAAPAAVITSFDFNNQTPTSATTSGTGYTSPGTFNSWQVQGGTDGSSLSLTGGIDTSGATGNSGDNALFAQWNRTGGTYDWLQVSTYYANPAGTGMTPVNLQLDFDVRLDGATAAQPLSITVEQGTVDTPTWSSTYRPTGLVNGQYQHVSYLLSQGTQGGSGSYSDSTNFSLIRFDPGGSFTPGQTDTLHIDNIQLSTVTATPEPGTASVLAAGTGLLAFGRRRRRRA